MKLDYIKIQEGDTAVFRQFYDDFYPSLCFYASKFISDEHAANDIVQEAFIYLWEKRTDFLSIHTAKSYLFKAVKHRCLNYQRDNHVKHMIEPEAFENISFHDFLIEKETYQLIYDAIQNLTPREKQVIELTLDGLKNQEIAECLDVSINSVKTLKLRAFKTLRSELLGVSLQFLIFLYKISFIS